MDEADIQELYEKDQELLLIDDKPTTYEEAATERAWKQSMKLELESIERNNTWSLAKLPKARKSG